MSNFELFVFLKKLVHDNIVIDWFSNDGLRSIFFYKLINNLLSYFSAIDKFAIRK